MRFWRIVVLTVLFSLANLILQVSFFGAVAWASFVDYLGGNGGSSFGVMPLFVSLSGASPLVMVPVIVLALVLQVWYYASLVTLVQDGGKKVGALLRQGITIFLRFAALLGLLFVTVRLVYFLLSFIAGLVFRYVGLENSSVEMVNRVFLLAFSLAIIVSGCIAGFSMLRMADVPNPLRALQEGFFLFTRSPGGVLWRVVGVLLIVYVVNELAAQIQLRALPVQWQALLSLLYLPFLFQFVHRCEQALVGRQ